MNITITGTRDISPDDAERCAVLFERYLAPFAKSGHEFFVGGGTGIDSLALQWLLTRQAPITVVVPSTVDDLPVQSRDRIRQAKQACLAEIVELKDSRFPEPEAFQTREQYMVDRSALVIDYSLGRASGEDTRYTLDYAASKDMPRLVVPL